MSADPVPVAGRRDTRGADACDAPVVCLLAPSGDVLEHPDYPIDVSPSLLRTLYRDMVLTRRLDSEATALQRQGELGLWASSLGQEAAQVGSAHAMRSDDFAFPTYRDHGTCLVRGVTPLEILALYRGISNGGWDPRARGMALPMIVIGGQVLHAVGYAMGIQLDRMRSRMALADAVGQPPLVRPASDSAAVAYFGDGASSQGDVNEAFVLAGVTQAPVVFFCQNNQWAISLPVARQMGAELVLRAPGFGLRGVRVDGNDVLAVLAVTRAALARARSGGGPTLIEAVTYRMGAHTTSDDPTRYRAPSEVEAWRARDPIVRLEAYLMRQGMLDDAAKAALDAEAEQLAETVRHGVRAMVDPTSETMFEHVYAESHANLDEQRRSFHDRNFHDRSVGTADA